MNNKIRNFIVFLLLRTPVYVLLVILYFNMIKCYLNNLKFFPEKINNSISWIIIVVFIGVLTYLIYISYSYYKNRISEGTITSKNFCVIYKNDEDIEMNFLNSYIFPIIAGFQEINFIWVIFLKILISIIDYLFRYFLRNILLMKMRMEMSINFFLEKKKKQLNNI